MINQNKVQIHKEFGGKEPNYQLLIDGYIVNDVKVGENYKDSLGLPNYYIISKTRNSLQQLADLTLNDLRTAGVESIKLTNWVRWEGFDISVSFGRDFKSRREVTFEVEFEPDLANWKFPYSYNDYYENFNLIWQSQYRLNDDEKLMIGGTQIRFMPIVKALLNDLSLREEIENNIKQFAEIHIKTISQLKELQFENSLLASFNFPDSLKTSCEQYLLYFAQFLKDLGVNATSDLKEETGKVLFSVTPTDENQALDKIREALAIYLNLPNSPIVYDDSFAAMRLQQQIENLQHSQRMAARELQFSEKLIAVQSDMLHEKNLTISQLQSVNEQQQKIIEKISSKSIMMDSVENKEELEELYDGIKVGESESLKKWLGISLNPAKAIKTAVKNTFGKEDKESVLGLDEDK